MRITALLKEFIKELLQEGRSDRKLRVFDFDDTLVVTDARVWVTNQTGESFSLTPGEYAVYVQNQGDVFDYSEFQQLINPRKITWTSKVFSNVYNKRGGAGVVVLTARGSPEPIIEFLHDIGYNDVEVVALGNSNPQAKADQIERWINERALTFVEFFDDSYKNVTAVKNLQLKYPGTKIVVRHIVHSSI